jgi:small subunit ribosomal protein S5
MANKMKRGFRKREESEFQQRIVDLARVTRVMAGGKRMRFRACVAIGDRKGRCGVGLAKGADVTIAINKAVNRAKKNLVTIPFVNDTIPHNLYIKHGASRLLLKRAASGSGIKAGGAIRTVLELAGVPNISAKILGTNNKINNVQALIEAVRRFKVSAEDVKNMKPAVEKKEAKTDKKVAPVAKKTASAVKKDEKKAAPKTKKAEAKTVSTGAKAKAETAKKAESKK